MKRLLLFILGLGFVGFLAIQLIPVNRTNPPVVREPAWDSPQTRVLAARACFDCHSNETRWPWYAQLAPGSWLVARDVAEGRDEMNFSEWRDNDDGEEAAEMVAEGEMPPQPYLLMHPEARLSSGEQAALIRGFEATFGSRE